MTGTGAGLQGSLYTTPENGILAPHSFLPVSVVFRKWAGPTFFASWANVTDKEVALQMKSDFIIAVTQLASERNLPREIVLSAIVCLDRVFFSGEVSIRVESISNEA